MFRGAGLCFGRSLSNPNPPTLRSSRIYEPGEVISVETSFAYSLATHERIQDDGWCFTCLREISGGKAVKCASCFRQHCSNACASSTTHQKECDHVIRCMQSSIFSSNDWCLSFAIMRGMINYEESEEVRRVVDSMDPCLQFFGDVVDEQSRVHDHFYKVRAWATKFRESCEGQPNVSEFEGRPMQWRGGPSPTPTPSWFQSELAVKLAAFFEMYNVPVQLRARREHMLGLFSDHFFGLPQRRAMSSICLFLCNMSAGHSCIPNAFQSVQGNVSTLRAVRHIPVGEIITISATNPMFPTSKRGSQSSGDRFMTCICERCSSPSENGTYYTAIACERCPKGTPQGAWMVPTPTTTLGSVDDQNGPPVDISHHYRNVVWKCEKCQATKKKDKDHGGEPDVDYGFVDWIMPSSLLDLPKSPRNPPINPSVFYARCKDMFDPFKSDLHPNHIYMFIYHITSVIALCEQWIPKFLYI
eukprot:TRINITY_DN9186_c0_g1_i2.p1 TRINITY_DN9186_c0_g1~~TRINITY_DN9186_c0_g1_i2.p1  ORF type:complete len:472 (+),score=42.71 TRINITY_DN9186_c0_g1_i2:24-1439(+)